MKIAYLGAGTWGFSLAALLASNGHYVWLWTSRKDYADQLKQSRCHPKLPPFEVDSKLQFTSNLAEALDQADYVIEAVTASGQRAILKKIVALGGIKVPFIITSKGIEQNTGLLLPEVARTVLGKNHPVGCLSGPSHAEEVIKQLPTSVVSAAYDKKLMIDIRDLFNSFYFRVYPNSDLNGVAFGGAMKNIIAIACGISDGLGFGDNTKAALMTRGLHEIRKLSVTKGCSPETLNGLSGMGDLCVTCLSTLSRNYMFGHHLASGLSSIEAKKKIGMAIEGIYSCVSASQLGHKHQIPVPITNAVYNILYHNLNPKDAVKTLLQRAIKEEHL